MKRRESGLEPELEALLTPRRIERTAPPEVRARALARGRAIAAAGGRIPLSPSLGLLAPLPAKAARSRGPVRFVLPASVAAAAAAIGALAALRTPPPRTLPPPAPPAVPSAWSPASVSELVEQAVVQPPSATLQPSALPKPAHSARTDEEFGPTELQLLARSQAAYTRRDFARAIALVGELARRFPNGHLTEEREALRVRSLFGAGRMDEGQRAAAAFAARFPRSVLLPKEGKALN